MSGWLLLLGQRLMLRRVLDQEKKRWFSAKNLDINYSRLRNVPVTSVLITNFDETNEGIGAKIL